MTTPGPGDGTPAESRCIGRTDLSVDRRKAKRLAGRIRATVRRHGLPRTVWASPLHRCAAVGEVLGRWGFAVRTDQRLAEIDFGRWDGLAWSAIGEAEVSAWANDLLHHRPGGGESLADVARRAHAFADEALRDPAGMRLVVGHGGWINALQQVSAAAASAPAASLPAAHWPAPPRHGQLVRWLPTPTATGARGQQAPSLPGR
jgi:alpha-ribazole phosphatase